MLHDHGLIVPNAIGGDPFTGQNARARGQVVRGIGSNTLPIEVGVFPDVHSARHLTNAISAIERDNGA